MCHCDTRIEEFAKEKVDLTLATRPKFDIPLADLTDVKAMMDSINVIPGLFFIQQKLLLISLV